MEKKLSEIHDALSKSFGPQKWWPAKGKGNARRFEICMGAILTQNTAWKNVEKAIENLRKANLLDEKAIRKAEEKDIALLIKPAGYYNQKAKKLKAFAEFLKENNFERLGNMPIKEARELLLGVYGVGKETADSILLYALNRPVFVVDAYTKRILERIFSLKFKDYDEWQQFFHSSLRKDTQLFSEYHALLVNLAKEFCRKKPECGKCPLNLQCRFKQL